MAEYVHYIIQIGQEEQYASMTKKGGRGFLYQLTSFLEMAERHSDFNVCCGFAKELARALDKEVHVVECITKTTDFREKIESDKLSAPCPFCGDSVKWTKEKRGEEEEELDIDTYTVECNGCPASFTFTMYEEDCPQGTYKAFRDLWQNGKRRKS